MLRPVFLLLVVALALSGCARLAESRLNPMNWFGGQRAGPVAADGTVRPLLPPGQSVVQVDGRTLIADVTDISLERTATGGILRATGLAATQGFFNAELVAMAFDSGVLSYEFRVEAPGAFQVTGTAASRRITVATTLTAAELAAVSSLRVVGLANARSVGG